MKINVRIIAIMAIALVSINVLGQSSSKLVDEMLEKTGSKDMFGNLDAMIASKIEERKNSFTNPQQFEQFKTMMSTGMNAKNAQKFFSEYLEKYSREDSLKLVISLYNDPFMQEFNQLEKASNSPEQQNEMMTFFQKMKDNPPAQGRIMQLVSLNNEMKTSEMMVKMLRNLAVSMVRGVNNSQPADKKVSDAELKNSMDAAFPAGIQQQITNQLVASMLFTYRNVSDEKLNRYIETWKSSKGRYCIRILLGAMDYSFSRMAEIAGGSLSGLDKEKK